MEIKISSKNIHFLILLYPFFYAIPFVAFEIGYKFSLFYFIPLTLFYIFLNVKHLALIPLYKRNLNIIILFLILSFILINSTTIYYTKPLIFFIYFINLYILSLAITFKENKKAIKVFSILFISLSLIYLFSPERYFFGNRYFSFLASPTVFSVYAEVFLIIILQSSLRIKNKVLVFLLIFALILITQTRINIIFLLLIPLLQYIINKRKRIKLLLYTSFIILLNLLYPIYNLVINSFIAKEITKSRYEDGRDASFGLRNKLNNLTYKDYYENSTILQKLFGRGSEKARELVIREVNVDIYTHNDFIRFAYDFGAVPLILFLILLYKIGKKNNTAFLLLLLYLFSFYHNMIYDYFLISLIIFYSAVKEDNSISRKI